MFVFLDVNDSDLPLNLPFYKVLEGYLRSNLITRDTAMAYASNATNLALAISDLNETFGVRPDARVEEQTASARSANGDVQIDGFER